MGRSKLVIVIPARNEEKTIKKVILSLKDYGDIVVVDDASSDKTKLILSMLNVKVIKNRIKLGYEETLLKGLRYSLKKNYKYIATFDADGEHNSKFFKTALKLKNFDLLIGKRKKLNRVIEYLFSFMTKLFFNIEDPLSGLRIYNKSMLKKIKLKNENMLNIYIIFKIIKLKGTILHKSLNVKKRKDDSRIGNSLYANLILIYYLFKLFFKITLTKFENLKNG